MPHYFASDIHLRNDRPDRDRRFRAWLSRLTRDDSLVIVGDLCDFWMGSRRAHDDPLRSESLRALAEFRRQGGSLAIMAGNHDEWLCPFYEAELGATIIAEPHDMTASRPPFTDRPRPSPGRPARLEGVDGEPRVLRSVRSCARAVRPGPRSNPGVAQPARARRRRRAPSARLSQSTPHNSRAPPTSWSSAMSTARSTWLDANPRLIVLGGWQRRSSFLKIDASGATFHVEHDCDQDPRAAAPPPAILNPPGRA